MNINSITPTSQDFEPKVADYRRFNLEPYQKRIIDLRNKLNSVYDTLNNLVKDPDYETKEVSIEDYEAIIEHLRLLNNEYEKLIKYFTKRNVANYLYPLILHDSIKPLYTLIPYLGMLTYGIDDYKVIVKESLDSTFTSIRTYLDILEKISTSNLFDTNLSCLDLANAQGLDSTERGGLYQITYNGKLKEIDLTDLKGFSTLEMFFPINTALINAIRREDVTKIKISEVHDEATGNTTYLIADNSPVKWNTSQDETPEGFTKLAMEAYFLGMEFPESPVKSVSGGAQMSIELAGKRDARSNDTDKSYQLIEQNQVEIESAKAENKSLHLEQFIGYKVLVLKFKKGTLIVDYLSKNPKKNQDTEADEEALIAAA